MDLHESNIKAFSFGFWCNYDNLMEFLGNWWHENFMQSNEKLPCRNTLPMPQKSPSSIA